MTARCDSVRAWDTGRAPFVGRPEPVIDLVVELLNAADAPGGADEGITATR